MAVYQISLLDSVNYKFDNTEYGLVTSSTDDLSTFEGSWDGWDTRTGQTILDSTFYVLSGSTSAWLATHSFGTLSTIAKSFVLAHPATLSFTARIQRFGAETLKIYNDSTEIVELNPTTGVQTDYEIPLPSGSYTLKFENTVTDYGSGQYGIWLDDVRVKTNRIYRIYSPDDTNTGYLGVSGYEAGTGDYVVGLKFDASSINWDTLTAATLKLQVREVLGEDDKGFKVFSNEETGSYTDFWDLWTDAVLYKRGEATDTTLIASLPLAESGRIEEVSFNVLSILENWTANPSTAFYLNLGPRAIQSLYENGIEFERPVLELTMESNFLNKVLDDIDLFGEGTVEDTGYGGEITLEVITVSAEGRHTITGETDWTLAAIALDSEGLVDPANDALLSLDVITLEAQGETFVKGTLNNTISITLDSEADVKVQGTSTSEITISLLAVYKSTEGTADLYLDDILVTGEIPQGGKPAIGSFGSVITVSLSGEGRRLREGELTTNEIVISLYARSQVPAPVSADTPFLNSNIPLFAGDKDATFDSGA